VNALPVTGGPGSPSDRLAGRTAQPDPVPASAAPSRSSAAPATSVVAAAAAGPGVQASFSPQGLWVAANTAHDTAGKAKDLVAGLVTVGSRALDGVENVLDGARDGAASLVETAADVIVAGIDAVHDAAAEPLNQLQDTLKNSAEQWGEAVQSTVAYASLAGLAGGLLVNELA
jgi:hypothetical protein